MALPHITDVKGIGQSTAEILSEHHVNTVEDLARIDIDLLIAIPGFSGIRAAKIINEAQALLGADETVGVVQPVSMESSDRTAAVADEAEPEKLESSKKKKKGKQAKKSKEKRKKKLKPEQKKSGKGKKSKTKDKKKKKK